MVATDGEESNEDRDRLHELWSRPWWPVAKLALDEGLTVTAMDPDGAAIAGTWTYGDSELVVVESSTIDFTLLVQPSSEVDG